MTKRPRHSICLVLVAIAPVAISTSPFAELSNRQVETRAEVRILPPPTGPFGVGRVTVHWTDRSRVEPLDPDRRPRELMVDVWYPADSSTGPTAAYFDAAAFSDARSAEHLRGYFRSAYDAIKTGRVRTHAIERAPFARSVRSSPVLVKTGFDPCLELTGSRGRFAPGGVTECPDAVQVKTPRKWQ